MGAVRAHLWRNLAQTGVTRMSKLLANKLHMAFVDATNEIRDRFGAANVGSFYLTITAEGRTMTDKNEVKIEYHLGTGRYDGASVKGNEFESCLVETLRRHGWDETHAPRAIAGPSPKKKPAIRAVEYDEADGDY